MVDGSLVKKLAIVGMSLFLACCSGWQPPSPICMAGAQLDRNGQCQPQRAVEHHFPFRAGHEARVTQGFYGFDTHREDLAFAVDFACEEGTPITASRSGVVWSVRSDSNISCPDPECVDDANYVIIDHGDGTYSSYFHLQHKGVVVEPGDQICRGQLLGLCGDTGYASGPHLHFAVLSAQWSTIPVAFAGADDDLSGIVLPRQRYESQNERQATCDDTDYSRLSEDAFAHRGILLGESLPLVVEEEGERRMLVEGKYFGEESYVAIHRRRTDNAQWLEQCVEVDEDGEFSFQVDWPEQIFDTGYYFLMLTGSDEHCSAPGWAWAYRVRVH